MRNNFELNKKLEQLRKTFLETFGYQEKDFPFFIDQDREIFLAEMFEFLSTFFLDYEMDIRGEYNRKFHIHRVCYAIEEGNFQKKLSSKTKKLYNEYRKKQWKSELNFYGTRLRWQIRLNRIFPNRNICIPAMDEIINHKILRFVSAVKCLKSSIVHRLKKYSEEEFYYMDRRYGIPIIVRGVNFDIAELFLPEMCGRLIQAKGTSSLKVTSNRTKRDKLKSLHLFHK